METSLETRLPYAFAAEPRHMFPNRNRKVKSTNLTALNFSSFLCYGGITVITSLV